MSNRRLIALAAATVLLAALPLQAAVARGAATTAPLLVVSPTSVAITSVVDASVPANQYPVVAKNFTVTAQLKSATGSNFSKSGVTVSLAATNGSGKLTGTLKTTTTSSGAAIFTVAYSVATNNLTLQASSTGLVSGSKTTNIVSAAAVIAQASPGISYTLGPITVGATSTTAVLRKGAYGPVYLYSQPTDACANGVVAPCETITLDMTVTSGTTHLYSAAAPAEVDLLCAKTRCPMPGATFDPTAEFKTYPLSVSLKINGQYQAFGLAPACSLTNSTGKITNDAAISKGYCMDVYAIKRDAAGSLFRPILFVEDPKVTSAGK